MSPAAATSPALPTFFVHVWIADPAALHAHLARRPARIGLDTEFIRERTYWPQLALVQIAIDDDGRQTQTILVIDPLVPGMCAALAPMLADDAILKVMHSPSEDLVAFKHACGVVPKPLFDTQQAAALAGIGGGLGYQKLVEQLTGVALEKGETRSDWLRRPLSPSQLEYAADDVRHLFAMHDALDGMLDQLDRREWLAEDAARTIAQCRERGARALAAPVAAQRAVPRRAKRSAASCACCAGATPTPATTTVRAAGSSTTNSPSRSPAIRRPTAHALQSQLDAHPKAPRKLGDAIWRALTTPLADEDRSARCQRRRNPRQAAPAQAAGCGEQRAAPNWACPTACSPRVAGCRHCSTRRRGPTPCPAGAARHWKRI